MTMTMVLWLAGAAIAADSADASAWTPPKLPATISYTPPAASLQSGYAGFQDPGSSQQNERGQRFGAGVALGTLGGLSLVAGVSVIVGGALVDPAFDADRGLLTPVQLRERREASRVYYLAGGGAVLVGGALVGVAAALLHLPRTSQGGPAISVGPTGVVANWRFK